MSALRDRYFKTLKIDPADAVKRRRALNRAYTLRTFEIEHYWKRATYFWGFQLAIFAAFGLLWKAQSENGWGLITLAVAGLGALTAVANYLSASGSKFWQENWERHIDMLEDEFEGRLHKTVWLSGGKLSYSVSRINQSLNSVFIIFWTLVLIYVAYHVVEKPPFTVDRLRTFPPLLQLMALVLPFPLGVVWLLSQRSHLRGTRPTSGGEHGSPINQRGETDMIFISRYAPDEPNNDERIESRNDAS